MLFNSVAFFVFFPIVTTLYFLIEDRWRWLLLLVASCIFYMFFVPKYLLILAFTILVDYAAGRLIERSTGRRRTLVLALSIVTNVGVLAVFKYFNFLNDNLAALARVIGWNYSVEGLSILLPIGLSFHTFQAMSYTIEVYRGAQKAERHLGIFALYVMFYPQLVAGPIERPQNLLHQFTEVHRFDYDRVTSGLRLMAWGLFKKMVVADRLAVLVDIVYGDPGRFGGPTLAVATVFFAFQIFCDFSGYSDIAVGSARVMGFRLMQNFDRPYHAATVAEFWRRWHISLSTWLRDYVFRPTLDALSARWSARFAAYAAAVAITFLLSGLWHGANWTFVVWGALNGAYLILAPPTRPVRARLKSALAIDRHPALDRGIGMATTFVLICVAWIFFRARTLDEAVMVCLGMLQGWHVLLTPGGVVAAFSGIGLPTASIGLAGIFVVEAVQAAHARFSLPMVLKVQPWWVRWGVYYAGVAAIYFLHASQSQFIYFQF